MRLSDILSLPKQAESLSIIQSYLEQPHTHMDHQAAMSHYFLIANHLGLFDVVFDEGMKMIQLLELQEETIHQEVIIKHIIDAALALSKYDDIPKLIELRREKLPILKQYLAHIDVVLYKKATNVSYLEDLQKILNDTIPDDIKLYCYQEIYNIYRKQNQYQEAMNMLLKLYQFDQKHIYEADEYELLVHLNRFDDVIEKGHQALKENEVKPKIIWALLQSYMALNQHHRAINLEAEYETFIDNQDDHFKKDVYELLIDLYTKEQNKLSLNIYQKKLKALQKTIEKKDTVKPKVVEEKPEYIIEPIVKEKSKSKDIIKRMEHLTDLIFFSHHIDYKLKLRDYLRIFFIEVNKKYDFKECLVFVEDQQPNFFFFKKERLYDKSLFENQLKDTMIPLILSKGEEVFDQPSYLKHHINPITLQPYDEHIKFVYGFPIGELGVFMVHLDQDVKDPALFYDDFKMISNMLYTHLIDEKHMASLKKDQTKYEQIIHSNLMPNRILTKERSIYNEAAQTLFHIDKYHHLELFLRDVSYEDVRTVKETIDYLFTHPNEQKRLTYRYQNKTIYEKLICLSVQQEMFIFSIFEDHSQAVLDKNELIEKATLDVQTGLLNVHALHEDLDEYLKDKASLLLIELDLDLKYIYGSDLVMQYFKEFGQLTRKYFNEGVTYRKDFNQLLVIVPQNDIRTVTKMIKDYYKMLQTTQSITCPYEKFHPKMSVLRYPVVTIEKKKNKLMHYLDIGIDRVKRSKTDDFDFFLYKDYEEETFEQEVIHYLNDAIENQQLTLVFNQITDIKKNKIWQYESELSIPHIAIANHYLMTLAKKRNRIVDLEKFHIYTVIMFLVKLEKETERLIKITIPISKETFMDPSFNAYLLGNLKTHQIPAEFIRLKLDMDVKGKYAANLLELIDYGISVDTTYLQTALNHPVHALHINLEKENIKTQSYLAKLKSLCDQFHMAFVMRGIKHKDQKDMIERLGIQYIEGLIYKQLKADVLIEKIKENL